ncbi:MAG: MATE family efflux transporter [Georgenia sp.]
MSSNPRTHALAASVNGTALLLPQVAGLLALDAREYGIFSLVYLVYSLGTSLSLSIVLDTWSRSRVIGGVKADWASYSSVLATLSAAAGVAAGIVALLARIPITGAVFAAIAVFGAVFRFGARYHEVQEDRLAVSLRADLVGLPVLLIGTVLLVASDATSTTVFLMWSLATLVSLAAGSVPSAPSVRHMKTWASTHRGAIIPLLRDSAIMDVSAIGTPYALVPLLGLPGIGVYRAVSSASAPIRLLLTTIRPLLARITPEQLRGRRYVLAALGISLSSALCALALLLTLPYLDADLGVLMELPRYAVPTAMFIGANFLGQFYAISMRISAPVGRTLFARLFQSVLAIAMPLAGATWWGIGGAIWGYSLATVAAAMVWAFQALRPARS